MSIFNIFEGVFNHKLLLYVDDSVILVAEKYEISNLLKKELETVGDWLIDNKLSLQNQYWLGLQLY